MITKSQVQWEDASIEKFHKKRWAAYDEIKVIARPGDWILYSVDPDSLKRNYGKAKYELFPDKPDVKDNDPYRILEAA